MEYGDITKQNQSDHLPIPFIGNFTRDLTLSVSTDTIVTGIGFKPTAIKFITRHTGVSSGSWGFDNGTNAHAILINAPGFNAGKIERTITNSIYLNEDASIFTAGKIKSLDSDGFTIEWNNQSSPTGTANILFIVFK